MLMVLKQDQALLGVIEGPTSNNDLIGDDLMAMKPKGMRTTKHSLAPSNIGVKNTIMSQAQQQYLTPRPRFGPDKM